MLRYEIKKVFSKASSKIAVILLLVIVGIVCWRATDVTFVNESGVGETGFAAVRKLRAAQKEWAGLLDEEALRSVIAEDVRIANTPQWLSSDVTQKDIAYSWMQSIYEIRRLLNYSYANSFRSTDYYVADSLDPADADAFYENRTKLLKSWLTGEAKDSYSDAEKSYLIEQYEALDTPFLYDYMKGWTQLLKYSRTVIMIGMLILGFLVAGIFSNEFSWKSDAVFFSAKFGRNRAIAAKLKAGFCIVTVLYWAAVLLYSGIVLAYLGADGWACPVQASYTDWKCFYNITVLQKYLLTVGGGYLGCLFISFLTMLVAAVTKSAVVAVCLPFVLIFIPSFLSSLDITAIDKFLALLPDCLLQISEVLSDFDLYELGGKVVGAVPVLFVLYGVFTLLLLPVTYRVYRRKRIG